MTSADCNDAELRQFCHPNIDVSNFLNLNSLINHDGFCLAYVFTYRDFSAGTLGLAWVGASNSKLYTCSVYLLKVVLYYKNILSIRATKLDIESI